MFRLLSTLTILVMGLSSCGGGGSGSSTNPSPDMPATAGVNDATGGVSSPPAASSSLRAEDCAELIHKGRFSIPVVLQNFSSECDYFVNDYAVFSGAVTIEPGTVILMGNDAVLELNDGDLNANGTAEQPIIIRGEQSLPGYWRGIRLTDLRSSTINHVNIMDGGNNSPAVDQWTGGLSVVRSVLSLSNTSISNSYVRGAIIDSRTVITNFSNNRFFGNAFEGLSVPASQLSSLDTASDYLGNSIPNGYPYIDVYNSPDYNSQELRGPVEWQAMNAPYRSRSGGLRLSGEKESVDIGPGTIIETNSFSLFFGASLRTHGTAEAPVIFRGVDGRQWEGLSLYANANGNPTSLSLDHTRIENVKTGVYLYIEGNLTTDNTQFINVEEWVIHCDREFYTTMEFNLDISDTTTFDNAGLGAISPDCPLIE